VESLVGVLVLIAVCAGLQISQLDTLLKEGGPIAAFSHGYGALSKTFLGDYGAAFAVVALNTFILTTLDTATRITRYITSELFGIQNMFLSTLIVVVAAGVLAITGQWHLLWPAFGATNQLIAGIALLVATCWLLNRGKSFYIRDHGWCFGVSMGSVFIEAESGRQFCSGLDNFSGNNRLNGYCSFNFYGNVAASFKETHGFILNINSEVVLWKRQSMCYRVFI